MRSQREFTLSGLCHLFNIIPVWGLLVCGLIWYSLREESRTVVRQARQAMTFHALMMAGLLAGILLELLSKILRILSVNLGGLLSGINVTLITLFYLGYAAICIHGALRCFSRQTFNYPLLGNRQ